MSYNDMRTKKLINTGREAVEEMIDGLVGAFPGHFSRVSGTNRGVMARHERRPGKVGLLVGGGSGHEPAFLGYVGPGLADAVVIGNVFASPPPDPIIACLRAVENGAGVLQIFGNYAGDVMNFGMAAELAALDGIACRTVLTTDDVASAPRQRLSDRRGVAGNFFVFKVAGAACDRMLPIDECERLARHANSACFTMGVGLSACSLPETLVPNFDLPADTIEIGIGIHGEPGVARVPTLTADKVVDFIWERLEADSGIGRGERVAVLVNSLGSTPLMELFILNRRLQWHLSQAGIVVHRTWVGPYCTSMEMAGASISILRLDDTLQDLLSHPAQSPLVAYGP